MAHITEIRIDGLLGREAPIHFRLQRNVNVFFGDNGSGKTTLLKILDAAMSLDEEAIARLPVTRAEVHIYSLSEKREIKHVWERTPSDSRQLRFDDIDPDMLSTTDRMRFLKMRAKPTEWRRTPPLRPTEKALRWSHSFLPTTRLYLGENVAAQLAARNKVSEEQLDAIFADSLNRAWIVFNNKAINQVRSIQESGLRAVLYSALGSKRDVRQDAELDIADAYSRVRSFLERQADSGPTMLGSEESFKDRYERDKDLRRVVANLYDVEQKVEQAMEPQRRFFAALETLYSGGKQLKTTNDALAIELSSGQILSPAQLSSGEKHLLKLLFTTLTAGGNSVIIDEPELSMHIDWQRVFVETVNALNPDCQLIVATHSPEIMAELPDSNIFRL